MGDPPKIGGNAPNHHNIYGLKHPIPDSEITADRSQLSCGLVGGELGSLQAGQFRAKPETADQARGEKRRQQAGPEPAGKSSQIHPFCHEMQPGDDGAKNLQIKTSGEDDLGHGARNLAEVL